MKANLVDKIKYFGLACAACGNILLLSGGCANTECPNHADEPVRQISSGPISDGIVTTVSGTASGSTSTTT
jgi:hypothetical protein